MCIRDRYYRAEAARILRTLASHPSFVMMAWGNELDTYSSDNRRYAQEFKKFCEAEDGTRLYAEGSNNNFLFGLLLLKLFPSFRYLVE